MNHPMPSAIAGDRVTVMNQHNAILAITGAMFVTLLTAGCTSTASPYVPGFRYAPEPALVDVFRKGTTRQSPPLSVMASIIGVRRGGRGADTPQSVEVRLRFENNGPSHVSFDPHSLELVTGTLQAFGPPIVRPPGPLELNGGQSATLTALFPFPPGTGYRTLVLDTLRLRWQVQIDNKPVPQTAYFERASPLYYED